MIETMVTRWLPMGQLARILQTEMLPPGGRLEAGRGVATVYYVDSGLRRVFCLARGRDPTRINWSVFVEDETYGNGWPLGPCAVEIRPPEKSAEDSAREAVRREYGEDWENGYTRPTPSADLSARLIFDLARWVRPALAFVADRRDLGYLLLKEGVVRRGELSTFLYPSSSRLVYSILLARHLGDAELEHAAFRTLAQNRDRTIAGRLETFGAAVAHSANEIGREAGVDLSDLVAAGKNQ
jgi:hypothetical protein